MNEKDWGKVEMQCSRPADLIRNTCVELSVKLRLVFVVCR